MKVEYLIIINSTSRQYKNKESFESLLKTNVDISINDTSLKYKDLEVEYELQFGEIDADKNRFFHIKLDCIDVSKIDAFEELLGATRDLLLEASKKTPQVIWDDVSFYYSELAYPLIHEIENLMRKLITKFMLTNVGLSWTKEAIPEVLRKPSKTNKIDNNNNYLYETDFRDLTTVLFDVDYLKNTKKLVDVIKSLDINGESIPVNELKELLPKSNWEKHFQEHVNCEGPYFKKRWDELYKFRCKIAHNTTFSNQDYKQVCNLIDQVRPYILDAIDNLDKIEVPEHEREELAEIVAIKTHALYGEYIQKWKKIEAHFISAARPLTRSNIGRRTIPIKINEDLTVMGYEPLTPDELKARREKPPISAMESIKSSAEMGLLEQSFVDELMEANRIRNIIVHDSQQYFSADDLRYRIENLDKILLNLEEMYGP